MFKCAKCKILKPSSDFFKRSDRKKKITSRCKSCIVIENTIYKRIMVFNITELEYSEMAKYGCHSCGKTEEENKRKLSVDHDHSTGKVRGILCTNCNLILGRANDSIGLLKNLIYYLEASNADITIQR